MRYAVIMAGGAGTRLWPMSRRDRPKQLLRFIQRPRAVATAGTAGRAPGPNPGGPRSLIELAAGRLEGLIPAERRYICTAEAYRAAIRADLPQFADANILGEPVGRDTLNAVGLSAAVLQKLDPGAVFAVFTADHVIEPIGRFQELIDLGFRLAEADGTRLVTFSIKPTHPATAYGYVERGTPITGAAGDVPGSAGLAFRVARFVEKPDLPRAQAYVDSGLFGWNSGMFVWRASAVMEALKRFKPESYEGLMRIQAAWGTARQRAVLEEVYPTLPKISVDFAIMEPASRLTGADRPFSVCTVQMDLKWLDVGSWPSFGETVAADAQGNRLALGGPARDRSAAPGVPGARGEEEERIGSGGDSLLVSSSGNLVVNMTPGHTVALLGCSDLIVVHTPDATLVMPRARAEELKELYGKVEERLK